MSRRHRVARRAIGMVCTALMCTGAAACSDAAAPPSAPPVPITPVPPATPVAPTPPPATPSVTPVISIDTAWLIPDRTLFVRLGRLGEPTLPGATLAVEDSAILRITWSSNESALVVTGRPGRTTLRAQFNGLTVTREVTVLPPPVPWATALVDSAAVRGGWDADGETVRVPKAQLRLPPGAAPVSVVALLFDAEDLWVTGTCAGEPLALAGGASLVLEPGALQYYNGYRDPLLGLSARLRLLLRDSAGTLRVAEATTRTTALPNYVAGAVLTPSWGCR